MALNASIFGNMLNAPKSPEEYAAERRQNMLGDLQYKNALQQQADDQAYREAVKGFGSDASANANLLRQKGLGAQAQSYEKAALDAQKVRTDMAESASKTKKHDYDLQRSIIEHGVMSLVASSNPDIARQKINDGVSRGMWGMTEAQQMLQELPNDPSGYQDWRIRQMNKLLSANDSLNQIRSDKELGLKQQEFGLKQGQFGETVRHNKSAEGIQIRGQNLVDARTREATQATMSKPFEVTGADGQPVLVQQDKQGNIRPVQGYSPKTAADKPLPEAAQKQVMGARNLQYAVGGYLSKLDNWSNSKMLSPDQRAEMGNAYNNMMLQAKEAYNLGVLNGPDYDILQSVVKDPTKLTSVLTSNEALSGQAKSLRNIAANIEKTALESHGKKYTPRQADPAKPAMSSEDQQAAAWANANPNDPRAAKIKQRLGL